MHCNGVRLHYKNAYSGVKEASEAVIPEGSCMCYPYNLDRLSVTKL